MSAAIVSSFHHDFRDFCKGLRSHGATSELSAHLHPKLTSSNSVATCTLLHSTHREHRKLDRSVSEPADQSKVLRATAPQNSSRYKTELCRPFEESGTCKYGDKCQFAHGHHELRSLARHPKYKTELCRTFHTAGFCPYGPRCHFIHNSEDSKKCLLDTLQPTSVDEVCSLGSAGELSPASSTCSGSPTSSLGGFFIDEGLPPPLVSPGFFFPADYSHHHSKTEKIAKTALDINQNVIRLPIFSLLAHTP